MPLTSWLDPILNFFARLSGLEGVQAEDYKAQTGGEALATAIEFINDLLTKGWLNKAVSAAAALICGAVVWGMKEKLDPRTKMELLAMGNHLLSRLADPKPSDVKELRESFEELLEAFRIGDWERALKSGLRLADEWREAIEAIASRAGISLPPSPSELGEAEVTLTEKTEVAAREWQFESSM